MKAKNIKLVICKKFNHLLANIRDDKIRTIVAENTILTGGAISSMLLNEEVNDYDIYFRTRDATFVVAQHYCAEFASNPPPRFKKSGKEVDIRVKSEGGRIKIIVQSAGVAGETPENEYQYFEGTNPEDGEAADYVERILHIQVDADDVKTKPNYRPVFLSSNAITLSDKVQMVIRFFGEPEEIHAHFDFVHCTNYWTSWNRELVLRPEALESLLARELRYVGSQYPLCSVIRSRKFIQQNWAITAGQYLKMAMQLNDLDLGNVAVLEEQLTGVDSAYFEEVIAALRKRDNNRDRVDAAYLVELVDRIF